MDFLLQLDDNAGDVVQFGEFYVDQLEELGFQYDVNNDHFFYKLTENSDPDLLVYNSDQSLELYRFGRRLAQFGYADYEFISDFIEFYR